MERRAGREDRMVGKRREEKGRIAIYQKFENRSEWMAVKELG